MNETQCLKISITYRFNQMSVKIFKGLWLLKLFYLYLNLTVKQYQPLTQEKEEVPCSNCKLSNTASEYPACQSLAGSRFLDSVHESPVFTPSLSWSAGLKGCPACFTPSLFIVYLPLSHLSSEIPLCVSHPRQSSGLRKWILCKEGYW